MGLVSKGAKCNVEGCDQDGARSLNSLKVENAGLRVKNQFFVKHIIRNTKRNQKTTEI